MAMGAGPYGPAPIAIHMLQASAAVCDLTP